MLFPDSNRKLIVIFISNFKYLITKFTQIYSIGTWTCAEGEVLCSDGSCMPTHDEHGCHNHCIVECSEDEQLCLGQAGHDHHEGHEHDRDFHDHGDCAEPDFCIHKDRKTLIQKP